MITAELEISDDKVEKYNYRFLITGPEDTVLNFNNETLTSRGLTGELQILECNNNQLNPPVAYNISDIKASIRTSPKNSGSSDLTLNNLANIAANYNISDINFKTITVDDIYGGTISPEDAPFEMRGGNGLEIEFINIKLFTPDTMITAELEISDDKVENYNYRFLITGPENTVLNFNKDKLCNLGLAGELQILDNSNNHLNPPVVYNISSIKCTIRTSPKNSGSSDLTLNNLANIAANYNISDINFKTITVDDIYGGTISPEDAPFEMKGENGLEIKFINIKNVDTSETLFPLELAFTVSSDKYLPFPGMASFLPNADESATMEGEREGTYIMVFTDDEGEKTSQVTVSMVQTSGNDFRYDITRVSGDIISKPFLPTLSAFFYPASISETETETETSDFGGQASANGDPYICTLDNQLYKMANFEGYSRMIQGKYLGKLFTINVATKMSSEKEAEESRKYVLKELEKMNNKYPGSTAQFEVMDYLNKNESFMSDLFIQWGNEFMTIDMNKLEILDNSSNFIINNLGYNSGKSFKDLAIMDHYKVQRDNSIEVKIKDLSIIVSQIDNPQVKTGFRLQNGYLIKNSSGALVNTLYSKDIKIKKLNTLVPIQRTQDRIERRIKTEVYLNNENQQVYKDIKMF